MKRVALALLAVSAAVTFGQSGRASRPSPDVMQDSSAGQVMAHFRRTVDRSGGAGAWIGAVMTHQVSRGRSATAEQISDSLMGVVITYRRIGNTPWDARDEISTAALGVLFAAIRQATGPTIPGALDRMIRVQQQSTQYTGAALNLIVLASEQGRAIGYVKDTAMRPEAIAYDALQALCRRATSEDGAVARAAVRDLVNRRLIRYNNESMQRLASQCMTDIGG